MDHNKKFLKKNFSRFAVCGPQDGSSPNKYLVVDILRVRRQSSRDAEEAMAGGLGKVNTSFILRTLRLRLFSSLLIRCTFTSFNKPFQLFLCNINFYKVTFIQLKIDPIKHIIPPSHFNQKAVF